MSSKASALCTNTGDDTVRLPRGVVLAFLLLTILPGLAQLGGADLASPPLEPTGPVVHDLLEWSAVCIAFMTAFLAFLCFHLRPDFLVLVVGLAFLATGWVDALHTLTSEGLLKAGADARLVSLTWSLGRLLKPLILVLGVGALLLCPPSLKPVGPAAILITSVAVGAVACLGVSLLSVVDPLPQTFFPAAAVPHPWNLPALVLYLFAGLLIFPLLMKRHPGVIAHSLLVSTLPDAAAQVHMAFGSRLLYDAHFNISLFLKAIATLVPLIGLSLHFIQAHRRELVVSARLENTVARLEREVRKRERAQDKLRSKELRLRQLTENIREVFWVRSPDGSRMFYVSRGYEDIFGRSCESLYRAPLSYAEVVHPADRERVRKEVSDARGGFTVEYRILHPHKGMRWIRTRAFPIRNDHGEIYRLAGLTEDVTEQKLAEVRLRRNERRTQAVLNAIPDLMFLVNREGVYTDYHARDDALLTFPPRSFMGKRVSEVFDGALGRQIEHRLHLALDSGAMQIFEYQLDTNGARKDWEARFVPTGEDEVLVIARDITDHKRLEREILQISNREQQRIGHDLHDGLSQHLTGIALLSKVLHQRLEVRGLPEAQDALRISELVKDAVGKTRGLARGLSPVHLEVQGLAAALQELAESVENLYGIRCRFEGGSDLELDDHATATHLYRIAQEAATNAAKHAQASQIVIGLTRRDNQLALRIQDDGTGIPDELSRHSGMGLHLMRYRARMIDGSLEIERAHKGTVVTCIFPARAARPMETW